MRLVPALVALLYVSYASTTRAQTIANSPTVEHPAGTARRTLGGHTFMAPAVIDSAFVETVFDLRTAARYERVTDVPFGSNTTDIKLLGVRQVFTFDLALADQVSIGTSAYGAFSTGTSPRALALAGAIYTYGVSLNGTVRIARIESTGTQIAVRLQLFGAQGGEHLTLAPFVQSIRNQPGQTVVALLRNFGNVVLVPTSWFGGAASVDIAQAISPVFAIQGSFRLDLRRFRQSPFVPGQGRVDVDSTGWLPSVGVALGVNPEGFPVGFLAEYRVASQDSDDPTSPAHHLVGLGGFYSARPDLQLGPSFFGEFGLPEVMGIDEDGNPAGSKRGTAFSGQVIMRYFW